MSKPWPLFLVLWLLFFFGEVCRVECDVLKTPPPYAVEVAFCMELVAHARIYTNVCASCCHPSPPQGALRAAPWANVQIREWRIRCFDGDDKNKRSQKFCYLKPLPSPKIGICACTDFSMLLTNYWWRVKSCCHLIFRLEMSDNQCFEAFLRV